MPIYLDSLLSLNPIYYLYNYPWPLIEVSRLRKLVIVDDDYSMSEVSDILKLCHDSLDELTIIPDLRGALPAQ